MKTDCKQATGDKPPTENEIPPLIGLFATTVYRSAYPKPQEKSVPGCLIQP
jgi:hypothetical protein